MADEMTGTIDTAADTTAQPTTDTVAAAPEATNWLEALPEELRDSADIKAVLADAEAYRMLEKAPEGPDGYKIEGMTDEGLKQFAGLAHELGLTQKQAEILHGKIAEQMTKVTESKKQYLDKARESLKADAKQQMETAYGKDAPSVEKVSREALVKWGDPELIDTLEKTGLIYHPSVIAAFYRIGSMVQPDVLVPSVGNQPQPAKIDKSGVIDVQYLKT